MVFRSGHDFPALLQGQLGRLGPFGQTVVLALVGDIGAVAAVLDQHVGVFGEFAERFVGCGGGFLVGADYLHGPVVAHRVGVVGLGQRSERLAVADVGAVFADADGQLLAVELAQHTGERKEGQRFVQSDGFDRSEERRVGKECRL